MKKKVIKRKYRDLPKYALGTMKPFDEGRQKGSGIGSATFTTEQGISLEPETQAIRQNALPKALNYAQMQVPFLTSMFKSTANNTASTAANTLKNSIKWTNPSWDETLELSKNPTFASTTATTGTAATTAATTATNTATNAANLAANAGTPGLGLIGTEALLNTTGSGLSGGLAGTMRTVGKTISKGVKGALDAVKNTAGNAASKGASGALGAASTALGAISSAIGGITMGSQIADFGSHRTGEDMMQNVGKQTYNTEYGNQYTKYGSINMGQEQAYESANARAKQLGFGVNSIGTGASLGGLVGGPLGMGIGALGGLILGGLGSLFGWGDNEEEVKAAALRANDQISMYNRQQEAIAKSKDASAEFNDRVGTAALGKEEYGPMTYFKKHGKQKEWLQGAEGKKEGVATSMVKNGETAYDTELDEGDMFRGKKGGDTIPSYVREGDPTIIFSTDLRINGIPFSKATWPVIQEQNKFKKIMNNPNSSEETKRVQWMAIAPKFKENKEYLLAMSDAQNVVRQQKQMNTNKYKDGKLPGFSFGTALKDAGRYLGVMSPNIWGFLQNAMDYNRAYNAHLYSENPYVEAPLAKKALYDMYNIRYDDRAERKDAKDQLNYAYHNINTTPGLTAGGQEVVKRARYYDYTKYLSQIATRANEFNANVRLSADKEAIQTDLMDQARKMQGRSERHRGLQDAAGRKDYALNTYSYNKYNTLRQAGADLYKMIVGDRADQNYKELIKMYKGNNTADDIDFLNGLGQLKPLQTNQSTISVLQNNSVPARSYDGLLPWQKDALYNQMLAQKIMMGGLK